MAHPYRIYVLRWRKSPMKQPDIFPNNGANYLSQMRCKKKYSQQKLEEDNVLQRSEYHSAVVLQDTIRTIHKLGSSGGCAVRCEFCCMSEQGRVSNLTNRDKKNALRPDQEPNTRKNHKKNKPLFLMPENVAKFGEAKRRRIWRF